jgi:hypothetical protein
MNELRTEIRQVMVTLPHFFDRVPMLYVRDGTPYVPVTVLCHLLGLRMEAHLSHWRKMLFWKCARKLPLQTDTRGKQLVWCLHVGALPFWYSTLNSENVVAERREQLRQATNELVTFPDIIYQEKLRRYQQLRRFLFSFLTTYTDTNLFFEQIIQQIAPFLDEENQVWFEELIAQGQEIITEALMIARKILHESEKLPVIDIHQPDHNGIFFETGSLPLLPTTSTTSVEDQQRFSECLALLRDWYQDFITFLREQKQEQR